MVDSDHMLGNREGQAIVLPCARLEAPRNVWRVSGDRSGSAESMNKAVKLMDHEKACRCFVKLIQNWNRARKVCVLVSDLECARAL
eukprot:344153-Amphidinium_carterae.1